MPYAYRCRTCGHLHEADHAGDSIHPHACQVCGKGVVFAHHEIADDLRQPNLTPAQLADIAARLSKTEAATKSFATDNWEVLADATPERLAELGLTPDQVAHHDTSKVPAHDPARCKQLKSRHVAVHAVEAIEAKDKAGAG